MAFPASTLTLEAGWSDFRALALTVKRKTTQLRDLSAAGTTDRVLYVKLRGILDNAVTQWAAILAETSGLQAYARDQLEDQSLDLSAEYTAMRNAAIALRDWLDANIPTGAGGAVLERQIDDTPLVFTSGQTAGFRTEADTLIATID